MLRIATASLLALTAFGAAAQDAPPALSTAGTGDFAQLMKEESAHVPALLGHVEVNTYVAPSGAFRIPIPVLQELNGSINDDEHLVTFSDGFLTHITIADYALNPTQRWEISTNGIKDFLIAFFEKEVLANYRQAFRDGPVRVEPTARYLPTMHGGSFIAFLNIPGGSFFTGRIPEVEPEPKPREAKYGVLLFVQNDVLFIISTELAEKAIEGSAHTQSAEKDDIVLRSRLLDLASQMEFTRPPKSD